MITLGGVNQISRYYGGKAFDPAFLELAQRIDWGALKARWIATNELATSVEAKLDFSQRATLLPPEIPTSRAAIPGVERDFLGFDPPLVPLMALPENLAEKLARFRRLIFARDLYDLWRLAPLVRDQLDLIRTIVGFKVYFDIIEEGQAGARPLRGGVEFQARRADEVVDPDDLGLVMGEPASIPDMLATVDALFGAMGPPSGAVDERVARIDPTDAYWVRQQYERLREEFRAAAAVR